MKYEWKKHDKYLYKTSLLPGIVDVPVQNFIMINGCGNPNNEDFSDKVSALYSLAYAIKMIYKSEAEKTSAEIDDFSVYPLEGVWSLNGTSGYEKFVKDNLQYTIMIRQPDFISPEMVLSAIKYVEINKPNSLYKDIFFDKTDSGEFVEILHIGSYDSESDSFAKMNDFIKENGLTRITDYHREIYLNNANRVGQDKLKTILRYRIKR